MKSNQNFLSELLAQELGEDYAFTSGLIRDYGEPADDDYNYDKED